MIRKKLEQIRSARTFTALRYRNFRLWFFGQTVSLFGTWMQITAQGYLIYELTQSPGYPLDLLDSSQAFLRGYSRFTEA